MAQTDLYKTLGVDKKAYRNLAREFHPDRNPGDARAEERFKEVSAAYDILGDAEKRKEYDQGKLFGGFSGGPGAPGGQGFDASSFGDIFSNLFGGGGGGGPQRGRPRPDRGRDLEAEVSLTFDQSLAGVQVPLTLTMAAPCPTCHGTGAKPGTSPKVCPQSQGRGVESEGQGLFSISQPCSRCGGSGAIIEHPCPTCAGAGQTQQARRLRVNIPAGVKNGSRVRIAGKGEPGRNGGPAGDLYVITRVASSRVFRRKGDNVEVEVPLTISEAVLGAEIEVPTLAGRKTLRVAPGTTHGTLLRLRGEGPPRLGGKSPGDIHYRFLIDIPKELTPEQSDLVDKLSLTMNGTDPRAGLFAAPAPAGSES